MTGEFDASPAGAGLLNVGGGGEMFVHRFLEVCRQYAERPCVIESGSKIYSYRQMLERASAIAMELCRRGVGGESVVGICVDKSFDYIACLVGSWLAGAAFLPVDAALPHERLQQMIGQSGCCLLIAQASTASLLRSMDLEVFTLPAETSLAADVQFACVNPSDLAYIIFTSGSTGKSKGVLVEHRGIVNFIDAQIEAFALGRESRVLFYLSTAFDASVSDIGTALLSGATLIIEPGVASLTPSELTGIVKDRRITHMDIPPSLLKVLDCDQMPDSLETVIIGGEACAPDVVRRWAARVRLVNVYGPTESTVCTSLGVCHPKTWERPLIGDPIAGVIYMILDEQLQEVEAGSAGELYIGGIALARGYLNQPELNKQKFILVNGERLYRTGDLVCRHQSGDIEFFGRTDRQVKVRGMLVAPEEVETRLHEHPDVARAVVLMRPWSEAVAGREVLIAFVTGRDAEHKPGASSLRQHLSQRLPRWMLPQHYELLDRLPLTVTGKVDLGALKALPLSRTVRQSGQPRALQSEMFNDPIKRIFCQVLALPSVEEEDNFFDLGGDSFAVIEMAAAAEASGLKISPSLLVAHPTVAGLAQALARGWAKDSDSAKIAAGGMSCRDLNAEVDKELTAILGEGASNVAGKTKTSAANILLTGATGFLGSRLLGELLLRTDARIYCLVRADSLESARHRLRRALVEQGTSANELDDERIVPLCGFMEKPGFALEKRQFDSLAANVDAIYHCAASVNMVSSYEELRAVNLQGTTEVARLMRVGREKTLHYASTLSVFVATDRNEGVAMESDTLASTEWVYGGYAQTKWASEVLLRRMSGSFAVTHYRLGLITADTQTGRAAPNDFLSFFVRGITAIGCVPPIDANLAIDITPVDYCARAIASLSLKRTEPKTYHIANPVSLKLRDLLRIIRDTGVDLPKVEPEEFLARMNDASLSGTAEAAACLALCRSLSGQSSFDRLRAMDLFQATGIKFDTTNTDRDLAGTSLICPAPSDGLVRLYLSEQRL